MDTPLTLLNQRSQDWLVGYSTQELQDQTQALVEVLDRCCQVKAAPKLLLVEQEPLPFLAAFFAGCATGCQVILTNPHWAEAEWQQVFDRIQPDLICRNGAISPWDTEFSQPAPALPAPLILVPTGGSSGSIRFAMHTWETLLAAVEGFRTYFGVDRVHACCVLPLHHVSGLMQVLRCLVSGGQLAILPFKSLATGNFPLPDLDRSFLSLVPTQLQRLLTQPSLEWLTRPTILLGGAPAWGELLVAARQASLRLAPTYGMTETAAQVATLKPEDFLRGYTSVGQVLPHAEIRIFDEAGNALPPGETGVVTLTARSLAIGYYPSSFPTPEFETDDLGYFDPEGHLHIVGRNSQKIVTGGENVFPSEVEAAIRATGLVADVGVVGVPDRHWGQSIVAVYVPLDPDLPISKLQQQLQPTLSKYKCPKRWLAVPSLPRNSQGKINYSTLVDLASRQVATAD